MSDIKIGSTVENSHGLWGTVKVISPIGTVFVESSAETKQATGLEQFEAHASQLQVRKDAQAAE